MKLIYQVAAYEGNFNAAIQKMSAASEMMENAIGNTGSTGQLSAILNDEAAAWLAFAAYNPNQLRKLSAFFFYYNTHCLMIY